MVGVPLGIRSQVRNRADSPTINVINRFFEKNPINQVEQVALIERPPHVQLTEAGEGPGRRVFTQAGFSDGDLFHVSGTELWKHHMNTNRSITTTQIPGVIDGELAPEFAATYDYLFVTDGILLQYTDGTAALADIPTPDDIPWVSLDHFNGYILGVQADSDRFYWIEPGDLTVDPLNFATAERTPDKLQQVRTVGDEFWLLGEKTTEVWRATGNSDAPFQRLEGRLFDRGTWGGTAVRVKDSVCVVGDDGMVYAVSGGPQQISDPGIAERIRDAILAQREAGF